MAGRSIRMAFLALATWAVLFAPGAAAADAGAGVDRVSSERVAAAIMAPTFGSDGVVMARSCRDDDNVQLDCGSLDGDLPRAPSAFQHDPAQRTSGPEVIAGAGAALRRGAPTRAPPMG
jgi:hypothetical protein